MEVNKVGMGYHLGRNVGKGNRNILKLYHNQQPRLQYSRKHPQPQLRIVLSRGKRLNTGAVRAHQRENQCVCAYQELVHKKNKTKFGKDVLVKGTKGSSRVLSFIPTALLSTALVSNPNSILALFDGSISTIQTALALGLVVTFHECGHFAAARLQGIHVSKFSVGFGPCLLRYKGEVVEYSIRAFPFGGFVAFPDESEMDSQTTGEDKQRFAKDDPDLLNNRPVRDRFFVIGAGVIANMIMAFGILWSQSISGGLYQTTYLNGVQIPEIAIDSVAQRSGLKTGDVITSVDGFELEAEAKSVDALVSKIKGSPDKYINFEVNREEKILHFSLKPEKVDDGTGRIGVQLSGNVRREQIKANDIVDGAFKAGKETLRLTKAVLNGFGILFTNFQQNVDKISGPVAIIANGSQYSGRNLYDLLQFMVIVNINLAVINTFPLPGLDGGYLLLLATESIRGKKLPQNVENMINQTGFSFLFFLGMVLLVKDTFNLTR